MGPSCFSFHLGHVLLWHGYAFCVQQHPPGNRAVQVSEGHLLFKHSLILEMFLWCNNQQFRSLRQVSSIQQAGFFCRNTCSPTSFWAEVPDSDVRSIQISLSYQLLKQPALFFPFMTDTVLYDALTSKHYDLGGYKRASGFT